MKAAKPAGGDQLILQRPLQAPDETITVLYIYLKRGYTREPTLPPPIVAKKSTKRKPRYVPSATKLQQRQQPQQPPRRQPPKKRQRVVPEPKLQEGKQQAGLPQVKRTLVSSQRVEAGHDSENESLPATEIQDEEEEEESESESEGPVEHDPSYKVKIKISKYEHASLYFKLTERQWIKLGGALCGAVQLEYEDEVFLTKVGRSGRLFANGIILLYTIF